MTGERPSGLKLRQAVVDDGAAICGVYLASRLDALAYLPRLHSDLETLHWIVHELLPASSVWVAEASRRIAGFLALKGTELEHLYVDPKHYRRGIGSQLLAKAREVSPERLHLFTFQRNARARAFYEAHGFVATEFNDGARNEEHEPDVKYEWTRTSLASRHP